MPSAFGYPQKRTLFRRICSTAHRPPCNTRRGAGEGGAKGCEMAWKGARIGSGGGGEVREKEGRGWIPAHSCIIPDFCFPDPKVRFEPIKSMVPRGLSPMRAGRGRKRSLKLVTQSPCHALPNFATIQASTRQTRSKRCMTSIARLGSSHLF